MKPSSVSERSFVLSKKPFDRQLSNLQKAGLTINIAAILLLILCVLLSAYPKVMEVLLLSAVAMYWMSALLGIISFPVSFVSALIGKSPWKRCLGSLGCLFLLYLSFGFLQWIGTLTN
jgi:hypothetical protein